MVSQVRHSQLPADLQVRAHLQLESAYQSSVSRQQ
jgi:hypothetical protein